MKRTKKKRTKKKTTLYKIDKAVKERVFGWSWKGNAVFLFGIAAFFWNGSIDFLVPVTEEAIVLRFLQGACVVLAYIGYRKVKYGKLSG